MAIDFGRMLGKVARPARNIATGYLSAKIANTEANDKMKANIIERAGLNFYENTLPQFQKREKNRKAAYDKVATIYGPEVAEFFGEQNLFTGDGNDFENITSQLKGRKIDKEYIKSYVAQQGSSYNKRYETRVKDIQAQEASIMGNLEKNQLGSMTTKLLLTDKDIATDATGVSTMTTETEAPKTETITTEGTMVPGTPIKTMDTTEEFPVQATEITGDFDKAFPLERKKLDLSVNDIRQLNSEAEKSFKRNIIRTAGGVDIVPEGSKYLIGYDKKIHKDKTQYAMDIYKKEYIADILEQYNKTVNETQVSSKFVIPEGTKVSDIVIQAREKISEIQGNPSIDEDQKDIYIDQIKTVVNEQLNLMNLEPSDFGF
jgi:hypothetical protein|tara:strand:- start:342 stop:1463 length:1122 start_codon:yes stop_codon:yes gene_type:complete